MAQRAQVLTAVEDFLYEVCLLVVFFPWYLARIVFRPASTFAEYRTALDEGRDGQLIVSPALFLMISAGVSTVLLPPADPERQKLFTKFARLFSSDATIGQIVATALPVLILAVCCALLIEWRTPGGVTRQSFKLPLFLSTLVASVMLMVDSIVGTLFKVGAEVDLPAAASGFVIVLVAIGWFLYAQSKVFVLLIGTSRGMGVLYTCLSLAMSEAVQAALPKG